MTLFLIGLITLLNFFLRFFRLGQIPFFSNSFPVSILIESAIINVISSFLIFAIAKLLFKKNKISLLSFFVFSVLPWIVETGRNGVYLNILLFWILILVLLLLVLKKIVYFRLFLNIFRPILFMAGMLVILFLLKKPDFIFSFNLNSYALYQVLSNTFHLASFGFLFFSNDSFWHGGNKDTGVLFLSFLPFLFIGVVDVFKKDISIMVMLLIIGTLLSVLNPYFPEVFEFYIVIPVFVLSVTRGLYGLRTFNKKIISLFILLFIFE